MSVDFFDANVFIYLFDETDRAKQRTATDLVHRALAQGNGVISFQVVQETLNVVTRKLKVVATADDALALMRDLLAPMWRVQPSQALYAKAMELQGRIAVSFYDRLIVAAALEARCDRLLTEDLQHGQRIERLLVENPFRA